MTNREAYEIGRAIGAVYDDQAADSAAESAAFAIQSAVGKLIPLTKWRSYVLGFALAHDAGLDTIEQARRHSAALANGGAL
jgi:hypothetical protein